MFGKFTTGSMKSRIVLEEYIPLYIMFQDQEPQVFDFLDVVKDNTDAVEFILSRDTKQVVSFHIILANSVSFTDEYLDLPEVIGAAIDLDVGYFEVNYLEFKIYHDGVVVLFSENDVFDARRCGDVVFGLGSEGNLVSLSAKLAPEEMTHMYDELKKYLNIEFLKG